MLYDIHTIFSPQDSILKISEYLDFISNEGWSAATISDSNNLHASVDFFFECKKRGIKPIIGAQVNFIENTGSNKRAPFKINLFAKDSIGYANLCRIISLSYEKPRLLPGFRRQHPRVDLELLEKYNKGLVCVDPTQGGFSFSLFEENKLDYLRHLESELCTIFRGDYHTLLTPSFSSDKFKEWCKYIVSTSPLNYLVGNSGRYSSPSEYEYYDMLVAIRNSQKFIDSNRPRANTNLFLKSENDLVGFDFGISEPDIKLGLKFSKDLVEQFSFEFDTQLKFPSLKLKDEEEEIKELVRKGWREKKSKLIYSPIKEYQERAKYELDTIKRLGYIPYFLVVYDIVNYARENGIAKGCGRGSAAGSLLSYLLGITDVDPLRYNLFFERFLDPTGQRVSPPDIDIDFQTERRDEIIKYIHERFGSDNTVLVGNITLLAPKSAIKDVARSLDIDFEYINMFTRSIRFNPSSIEEIQSDKDLSGFLSDNRIQTVLKFASKLTGTMRQIGTHAAGVVVAPNEIINYTPTQHVKGSEFRTSHLNKDSLEKIGLLKLDILGLAAIDTLSRMKKAIDPISSVDLSLLDLDDPKIYEDIRNGLTVGLFQVEGEGITKLARKMKPEKHSDICDLVALYRPAVLGSKLDRTYLSNRAKGSKDKFNYVHPKLKDSLADTYGILLFQEQLMESTRILAGFTLAEADQLRKAIGKKKIEELDKLGKKFFEGCASNGLTRKEAEDIFEIYHNATSYGFNKSHSIAYSMITCQMAWFKHYHPKVFYTNCLTTEQTSADKDLKFQRLRNEMALKGIHINPPDINISSKEFSIYEDKIYCSLGCIKGVSSAFIDAIFDERTEKFKSFDDFLNRINNRLPISTFMNSLETLILVGVYDSLESNRSLCLRAAKDSFTRTTKRQAAPSLFSKTAISKAAKVKDLTFLEKKEHELKSIGLSFS